MASRLSVPPGGSSCRVPPTPQVDGPPFPAGEVGSARRGGAQGAAEDGLDGGSLLPWPGCKLCLRWGQVGACPRAYLLGRLLIKSLQSQQCA